MTLKEWLADKAHGTEQTREAADIFAQLFEYAKDGAFNADDLTIDGSKLVRVNKSSIFEAPYIPLDGDDDPVFVTGLMMCRKVSGRDTDMTSAGLLVLASADDDEISLCRCEESSLDSIISGTTKIVREKRMTADEALDALAALYPSKAEIAYTDTDSGAVLYTEQVLLTGGHTVYIPHEQGEAPRKIFPQDERIVIPYRASVQTVECRCYLRRFPDEEMRPRHTQGIITAVHKGRNGITAVKFAEDGRLCETDTYDDAHIDETDPAQAAAFYCFDRGAVLSVHLGYEGYICAYPDIAERDCISAKVPLGTDMTDVLYRDMLERLRVSYHIDLSDEMLYKSQRAAVTEAAERIKCRLSFDERVSYRLMLDYENERRSIIFEYDRYGFENRIRHIISGLRSAVMETLSRARIDRERLMQICVDGGSAPVPAFDEIFRINDSVKVRYIPYRITARGLAVYADRPSRAADDGLGYDLGLLRVSVNSNMPVFEALAKAGTALSDVRITIASDTLSAEKENGTDTVYLKLYSRKKGMEHVKSTFDPEGSAISYLGKVRAEIPDGHRIIFVITAGSDGIHADGLLQKRKGMFGKLAARLSHGESWVDAGRAEVSFIR